MRLVLIGLCAAGAALAQNEIDIKVNASIRSGPFKPVYGYFGYDEPNYTYTKNGRKLIGELAGIGDSPVFIRTHFMLATGDGTPGLKFGSTNAYIEDSTGKPIYNWTVTDRIFDTYLKAGAKPFVEVGFMPQALSSRPEPYTPTWIPGGRNDQYYIGWTYPPKDFAKWGELVNQWVSHAVSKYGRVEVASWYWEVWNEPDIGYWHGTAEEYDKLYDFAVDGIRRALPEAKVGGPATTGPAAQHAADYLRQFLEHCASRGIPLDFITFHAKGRPAVIDGNVRMGIGENAEDVDQGFKIIASFPKFRNLPIVISESDPEGCAACSARLYPQNNYRNGPLYPAYEAAMMKNILDLAEADHANIAGMLTWAFEFEDQPYFDGLRTLATNGIDKPVLNFFRMAGMMRGDRLKVESTAGRTAESIVQSGVRGAADVDAVAVGGGREVSVLVWNYHDDDVPAPPSGVHLNLAGLPPGISRAMVRHYRIDATHSNAWSAWKNMNSPRVPTAEQYAALETAGQLELLESPRWVNVRSSTTSLDFSLPRQGTSLIQLSW